MKYEGNVIEPLKMNIQLLASEGAEPGGEPTDEPEAKGDKGQEPGKPEVKTFTQDEVNKMIEQRLAREKKKAEQERQEAEELAKLSEADRQKKLFEKQVAEFEEMKAEFERGKLKEETRTQLQTRNIMSDFDEFVLGEDAESTLEKLNRFETLLNKAIELAVNERLKGTAPKASGVAGSQGMTKEDFKKLNLMQRNELFMKDPDLYKELSAR